MSRVDQILSLAGLPNSSNSTSGCDNTKLKSAVLNSNQAQLFGNSQRERVEIEMWLTFSAKTMNTDMLKALNNTLLYKTYLVRSSVSIADFAVFHSVSSLKYDDLSNLTRWIGNMTSHICLKTSVSASISSNTFIPIPVMDSETTATPASAPTTAAPVAGLSAAVKNATVDSKTGKDAPAKEIAEASGASLDPSKLEIRCGLVVKCWNHPDSDKLLCEEIDVGNGEIRTIASGLRAFYTADQLQGRKVAVLANLKERSMAGFKSQVSCSSDILLIFRSYFHEGTIFLFYRAWYYVLLARIIVW